MYRQWRTGLGRPIRQHMHTCKARRLTQRMLHKRTPRARASTARPSNGPAQDLVLRSPQPAAYLSSAPCSTSIPSRLRNTTTAARRCGPTGPHQPRETKKLTRRRAQHLITLLSKQTTKTPPASLGHAFRGQNLTSQAHPRRVPSLGVLLLSSISTAASCSEHKRAANRCD